MKMQLFSLVTSLCASLGGCVGSGELAASSAGNAPSALTPATAARLFSAKSLYIQGLHSSWTITSAGNPNVSGTQSQSSNTNHSTEVRPLKSTGFLVSGGEWDACYVGSDRSDIYIGYAPGGSKSDSYTCSGNAAENITRSYRVSYNSTSSYDGNVLQLDGTLTIHQSIDWKMGLPNEEKTLVKRQTATIRFDGKTCSVESYHETKTDTGTTPESSRHYAQTNQTKTEINKQNSTKCVIYR